MLFLSHECAVFAQLNKTAEPEQVCGQYCGDATLHLMPFVRKLPQFVSPTEFASVYLCPVDDDEVNGRLEVEAVDQAK